MQSKKTTKTDAVERTAAKLKANVDRWYANEITHETFCAEQRRL